ncbi:uncharacterized protein LOC125226725 isoform X2 [Leguminivora glycinivorella]|uniref:uncharacterized protein LOC125226725 isoform X2 n=1 Tax=Leguminivora glycinivorella TaxID=1035111 RepID=UPI00200C2A2C|nr:uncharacterized protein LOC125226725 isoform X2 [Leguminivora glycinivorella]
MDKKDRKTKRKAPTKPRSGKKRTSEGPACSMFLVELSRKLAQKKRDEQDAPINIVGSILNSLTNALPVTVSKGSPVRNQSPVKIETLQSIAPELQPNNVLEVEIASKDPELTNIDVGREVKKKFKMPKMPVISSDVFKQKIHVTTEDVAVNTSSTHDMASSLAKYVDTLKKISLIAEEFNQKTAKNLKEIVDSVQEDLQVKLEELVHEQKVPKVDQPMQVVQEDIQTEIS